MPRFSQVDVFTSEPLGGNPVAVVHDAEGLTDEQMQRFANWTNLSETAFLLPPTTDAADYRLRIFTPAEELPFAGHPTIGSAHAWLEAGGTPRREGVVVQECGAGLVELRRGDRLAFAAPPTIRSGPVAASDLSTISRALRIEAGDIVDAAWVDNGPGWVGILLADADAVLGLEPDWAEFGQIEVGVVGAYPEERAAQVGAAVEVRAFCPGWGSSRIRSRAASTRAWRSGSSATAPSRRAMWPRRAPAWAGAAGCTSTARASTSGSAATPPPWSGARSTSKPAAARSPGRASRPAGRARSTSAGCRRAS